MPDVFDQIPSNTSRSSFTMLRLLAVKVAVHSSSHSCSIDMRYHDCRLGEMCDVLDVSIRRGFSFSTYLWVAYMRLLLGSITWGLFLLTPCCYMGCLPLCSYGLPLCRLCRSFID